VLELRTDGVGKNLSKEEPDFVKKKKNSGLFSKAQTGNCNCFDKT